MKRFKIFTVLMMLSTLFMAMTCDEDSPKRSVIVKNESQDTIWYAATFYYEGRDSLTSRKVFLGRYLDLKRVLPGERGYVLDAYDDDIRSGYKYYMLLYKQQTLNNHSVMEIVDNDLYDGKYVFTFTDLDKLGFQIIYDGK